MLISHIEQDYIKVYPKKVTDSFKENAKIENIIERFSDARETVFCFKDDGELIETVSILKDELKTFYVKIEE